MAFLNKQKGKVRIIHKKDRLSYSRTFTTAAAAKKFLPKLNNMLDDITSIKVDQKNLNFKSVPFTGRQWAAIEDHGLNLCEILAEKLRPAAYTKTVHEAIIDFLTNGFMPRKKPKTSPNGTHLGTIKDDGKLIGRLAFWDKALGDKRLIDVTVDDVEGALEAKAKQTTKQSRGRYQEDATLVSKKTIDNYLEAYRSFSHWCVLTRKYAEADRPESTIRQEGEDSSDPTPLGYVTLDDLEALNMDLVERSVKKLLAAAEKYDKTASFNKMHNLCLFGVTTGRRRAEMTGLRWNHLDFKKNQYAVVAKGKKTQYFPLVGKLARVMKEMRAAQKVVGLDNLVFALDGSNKPYKFDDAWLDIVDRAGLQGHTPHDMRDTCATMVLNNSDGGWSAVASVLGHSEVGALQKRYARFFPEVEAATLLSGLPAFLK